VEGAKAGIKSNVICPVARARLTEELFGAAPEALAPELVTPMVVFLASVKSASFAAAGRGGTPPGPAVRRDRLYPLEQQRADHLAQTLGLDGAALRAGDHPRTIPLRTRLG